jgi:Ca2+-binding RTX toxin-like protein
MKGRMKGFFKGIRVLTVLMMLVGSAPYLRNPQTVFAADADATAIKSQLQNFATLIRSLAGFDKLGQFLPLTGFDPTSEAGTRIDQLFEDIKNEISTFADNSLADIANGINGLDGDYGGVQLSASGPAAGDADAPIVAVNGSNGDLIDVQFELHAVRTVNVPFDFAQPPVSLQGGAVSVTLDLDTVLQFQLDKTVADPLTAFYLVKSGGYSPKLTLATTANAAVPAFASQLGFTDITASGNSVLNIVIETAVNDPDSNGRITVQEWINSSIADLFDVNFVDGPGNDVSASLTLAASVGTVPVSGTLTLVNSNLAASTNLTPTITLGGLADFANMSTEQMLQGIALFAGGILASQGVGDLKIPFTDSTLSDAFGLGKKLLDFVAEQADALVLCGTTDGLPPRGSVKDLADNTQVFCRAITNENPTAVTWTVTNGDGLVNANSTSTVGLAPSQSFKFNMTAAGKPDVKVQFTAPDTTVHTAKMRFLTLQDLKEALTQALGLDNGGLGAMGLTDELGIDYDSATKSLKYALSVSETLPYSGDLDFSSQLSQTTGLIGLTPDSGAALIITPSAQISITFGAILVKDVADITPGDEGTFPASQADRFFVQVDNGTDKHELTADALLAASINLKGRIGFVEVGVTGDAASNPGGGGTAFTLGKVAGQESKPMLAVDINAPAAGIPISTTNGNVNLANAIRLRELIPNVGSKVSALCNAKVSAGLMADAKLGTDTPTTIATGTIGINWPNVFGNDCVPDLGGLSVTPSGGYNENLLSFNLDDANPQRLLSLFLDNLNLIADALASLPGIDQEIPIVKKKISELLRQATILKNKLTILATGGGNAPGVVFCDTADNGDPNDGGDKKVANVAAGTTIYCRAKLPAGTTNIADVQWTGTGVEFTSGAEDEATVGTNPAVSVVLKVTDPNSLYKLNVAYKSGTPAAAASADYPAVVVPESLQALERELEKLTGLPDDAFRLEMKNVDGDAAKELVFRLGYGICTPGFDATLSDCSAAYVLPDEIAANLNFDFGSNELVGVQGSGNLELDFGAIAKLNGGIDLNGFINDPGNPLDALFVLNSSKLEVAAKLDSAATLNANIGPLEFQAGPGSAKVGADLRVGAPGSPTEQNEAIAPLTDLTDITFGQIPGASFECPGSDGFNTQSNFGCARLPLSLNGTPLNGDLALRIDSLDPLNVTPQVPTDLADQLANALLSWNMLFEGLNYVLDMAENGLRSKAAESIPFIGKDLAAGADIIQKAQDNVVTPLQDVATRLDGLNGAAIETCVNQILFHSLNGGGTVTDCAGDDFTLPGVALLKDVNAPQGVDMGDVVVTALCGNDNHDCLATDGALTVQSIKVEATIGQDATFDIPLDLGFPGLRLRSVTDTLESSVGWEWYVSFTLNRTDGFAINPRSGANQDEIAVTAGLTLPETAGAELAFLQADITDNHPNDPSLSLTAGVDYGTAPITLANIGNFSIEPSFHADADLDVHIITTLRGGESYGFPSVHTDFSLQWVFDPSLSVQPPTIEFTNVELDAGKFVSQFLAPIVEKVQKLTRPLQPIIDVVSAPVPGLSDLSQAAGGPEITLLSIMKAACGDSCNTQFIDRVIAVITFVNGIDVGAAGSTLIPLGDFSVLGDKAMSTAPTPDQALDSLYDPSSPPIDVGGFQSSLGSALSNSVKGSPSSNLADPQVKAKTGLSFPFLENPKQIFGLLLGQDITLIYADTGFMGLSGGFSQSFGPIMVGPIPVSLGVFVNAKLEARFAMGFDSSGIRKVLTQGSSGEHLFDGIFIDDLLDGKDIAEIQLSGQAGASASVNLLIVEAGVKVGISLVVGMNLHDDNGDGKLRIDEVFNKLNNPICLFDLEGKLSIFIALFVKLNLFLVSKEWDFVIVDITLIDFNVPLCSPPDPEPATLVNSLSDGGAPNVANGQKVLRVNIGPFASARNIQTGEAKEEVVIRQIKRCTEGTVTGTGQGATCSGTVKSGFSVAMFGAYKEYLVDDGTLFAVYANGGSDDDKISYQAGTNIDGSTPVTFTFKAVAYGGANNDIIQSGDGNDQLFGDQVDGGGSGNDTINGNGGTDTIEGDAGDDNISGDAGNDIVKGEAGNDSLTGGDGNDELYGGDGDDSLGGGKGRDYVIGNTGTETNGDNLSGNEDEDIVVGGNDPSLPKFSTNFFTTAVNNACLATGGTGGPDTIEGGPANDLLLGGPGNDGMIGAGGDDRLCGLDGNDQIVGDDPNDPAVVGDDRLEGGNGDDDLRGGGNTNNVTTNGLDVLLGGNDNDTLYGEAGPDVAIGGAGRDLVTGGPGVVTDLLLGDNATVTGLGGDVAMTYDAEAQATQTVTQVAALVSGITAGTDTGTPNCSGKSAGTGTADCVVGSEGNDVLFGEAGNDIMYGDEVLGSGSGQDYMHGNDGADNMRGGGGHDIMFGDNSTDEMYGDSGNDFMYGNANDDTMHGNTGDDYMEGNNDDNSASGDTMHGDAGQDDMMGGSPTAAAADGGDTMYGNADYDVMLGDNALITRPLLNGNWQVNTFDGAIVRNVTLHDVPTAPGCIVAAGGADEMYGNDANDRMWGQNGNDDMSGGNGDDYMEGNAGNDNMAGDAGNDDMVGGTGRINNDPPEGTDGRCDGGEGDGGGTGMRGGAGFDFMAGDNAVIKRKLTAGGAWIPQTWNGGIEHEIIFLRDLATTTNTPAANTGGIDHMFGDSEDDIMYGQGGNDIMDGGTQQDYMEGNAGSDSMKGNVGQDDITGGTGRINNDPVTGTPNRLDTNDFLFGELSTEEGTDAASGVDAMAGDNSIITRPLTAGGLWQVNTFNGAYTRNFRMLDVATLAYTPGNGTSGGDIMYGNSNDDVMYGQGGDDSMYGNAGQDYMEGNADSDTMFGGGSQDDMTGGTGRINDDPATGTAGRLDKGDKMYGDSNTDANTLPADGHDSMAGDNAIISRPLDNAGAWIPIVYTHTIGGVEGATSRITRNVYTPVDPFPSPYANTNVSGSDLMRGNGGDDDMYGQYDDHNTSTLTHAVPCYYASGANQIEGDLMCGDAGEDAMLGDNGKITNIAEDGSRAEHIEIQAPFISEDIFQAGSLTRLVELVRSQTNQSGGDIAGGNDVMQGGDDNDRMSGGAGYDLMNGNGGDDAIFGDDGDDAVWGGTGDDHTYGGYGPGGTLTPDGSTPLRGDYLEIQPRPAPDQDPSAWFLVAPNVDTLQGYDIVYGGWGRDAMQADISIPGPTPGDRLIDWTGAYNIYFLCPGAYGEGAATRLLSPDMLLYLPEQALGDGAFEPTTTNSSGFDELGLVYTRDVRFNSGAAYPDTPGHFVCPAP